jgi:hypothetical protein
VSLDDPLNPKVVSRIALNIRGHVPCSFVMRLWSTPMA